MFYCQIHNHYSLTDQCPVCFPVATASASTDIQLPTPLTEFIERESKKYIHYSSGKYPFTAGANLMLPIIEEKDKEIERLKNLIKVRERSSHHAFYSHATTMTEFQIEKQFNERWQNFKEQNNL